MKDKLGHVKKLYEAKVDNFNLQKAMDPSLLGVKALQATSYRWADTDQKSRKALWMPIIKSAIVEEQRIATIRKLVITTTVAGHLRHWIQSSLSDFAISSVRSGKTVYEWNFFDGINVPARSSLPSLPDRSFEQRLAIVAVEDLATFHRSEIVKIIKAVKSSSVASFSGEKKDSQMEQNVWFALDELVKASPPILQIYYL